MLIIGVGMLKSRHFSEDPEIKLYRHFCRKMAEGGIQIHPEKGQTRLQCVLKP